ncbi:MAG: hypothetical protein LAP39_24910 [Acidobacteriia bacterium]|nr:hypothetical protein [Terriglobia bacterium]
MRYLIARILPLSAVLLATSFHCSAQPVSHVCKSATLSGAYGYLMTGQIFLSQVGFVSFTDSGSLTWNGSGKVTGSSTLNVDGQIASRTLTGTYTVNADCTGSLKYTDNLTNSASINMVIIGSGVQIQFMESDSGAAISGNAKPQQTNCTAQDVSGAYGFGLRGGFYDSTGTFQPFADSGTLTSDGNGTFTLSDTASIGGTAGNRSMSGKYTVSSNCTGSTTLADSAGNSTALNFTVVSGGGEILFSETDSGVIIAGSALRQFAKAGILSQLASGGGWKTTISLENISSTPTEVRVEFWADSGSALTLPFTATLQGNTVTGTGSSVDQTMNPGATLRIDTEAPASATTLVGWAQVYSSGPVAGFAIFREQLSNGTYAEGTSPLEDRNISDLLVPFDNTGGFVTGVALVNSTSVHTTLNVTIRDAFGNKLGSPSTIVLPANGHLAFVATDQFAVTKGQLGTIEFQPASSSGIAGLGLRFSPFNSFTSVPVIVRR